MMVNKIFMYGLVSYRKEQLLFYCLCWSYPCDDEICFVHYRNTLKVSYKTTANMSQVISRHNKKVSNVKKDPVIPAKADCNCQKSKLPCIMGGKCVPGCVVYQGAVTRKDTGKTDYYTGLS